MTSIFRRAASLATAVLLAATFASPADAATPIVYSNWFDNLAGVTSVRGGQPTISGGALRLQGTMTTTTCGFGCSTTTTSTETAVTVASGMKFSDGMRYDVDVRFDAPSIHGMHGGLLLTSSGQYRYGAGHAVTLDYFQQGGHYRLRSYLNGTEIGGVAVSAPVPTGWHRYTLRTSGSTVMAAIDGVYLGQIQLSWAPGPMALGMWTYISGVTSFDNAVVRPYAPPTVASVPSITVEASGPAGSVVTFPTPAGEDGAGATLPVTCNRASGSTFALGSTVVQCTARDFSNQVTASAFSVNVVDTTAPTISAHDDIVTEATGPDGAIIEYASPATHDVVDGEGVATCLPASGSLFPVGVTTVACTAVDAAGNESSSTFEVEVIEVIEVSFQGIDGRTTTADLLGYVASVTVAYPSGTPADGASVTVTLTRQLVEASMTFEGVAGPDGRFTFQVPPQFVIPGSYTIQGQADLRLATDEQSQVFEVGVL